jgi:F-type H+-transporting ATPase subunit epsilon
MHMATLPFELVSPSRLLFSGEVEQVDVPGAEGDFGVLPGHAPFISMLRPGILTIRNGNDAKRYFVRGGFAEVNPEGFTVLAEIAVPVEEVAADAFTNEIRAIEKAMTEARDDAERWKHTELLEQMKAAATHFSQVPTSAAH